MKTYFVHLDSIAITINTDGKVETFKFKTKRQAEKKILRLFKAGYTFDRFAWSESNPDYAPTPDAEF